MKKLQLNKETIARLNNPEKIMGGEATKTTYTTMQNSFAMTCEFGYTCGIVSCPGGPTCITDL